MANKFSAGDRYHTIDTGISMAVSSDGSTVDVGPFSYGFIGVTWSGANANDGTMKIEVSDTSLPGSWEVYPNSPYILDASNGVHYWDFRQLRSIPYLRVSYTAGSNTTGTFNTSINLTVPV